MVATPQVHHPHVRQFLLFTTPPPSPSPISRTQGTGGNFQYLQTWPAPFNDRVPTITIGDLDGDGRVDVVAGDSIDGSISWARNLNRDEFAFLLWIKIREEPSGASKPISGIVITDTNQDGINNLLFLKGAQVYFAENTPPPDVCKPSGGGLYELWVRGANYLTYQADGTSLPTGTYYPDADNDGFAPVGASSSACPQSASRASKTGDCDDRYASAHPGATEILNTGIDEDCNIATFDKIRQYCRFNSAPEPGYYELATTQVPIASPHVYTGMYWPDLDGDGLGDRAGSPSLCPRGVPNKLDVDDSDPTTAYSTCKVRPCFTRRSSLLIMPRPLFKY